MVLSYWSSLLRQETFLFIHLNVWFLVLITVQLRMFSLDSVLLILLLLNFRLNICHLFSLLALKHLGIDVLYSGLDIRHTRSRHRDGAGGEDLQSGLGDLDLVSHSWVKLGLVGSFFESLRERDNFDGERKGTGAQDIDDPPVFDANIFVFIVQPL